MKQEKKKRKRENIKHDNCNNNNVDRVDNCISFLDPFI